MNPPMAQSTIEGRDVVMFLGAGFSYDAGMPTMAEFGTRSIQAQPNLLRYAAATPPSRHAAPLLMNAHATFDGFRKVCMTSGTLPRSDWNNIEDVFCVAEGLLQAGQQDVLIDGSLTPVSTVVKDIQLWIWKTYQQLPLLRRHEVVGRPVRREPYEALFSFLRERNLAERLVVLTTNYDLVFEYLAAKDGIPCQYPFDWPSDFKAGGGAEEYVRRAGQGSGPVLCKLHGSVNYFADREENPGRVWVAADIGDGSNIGKTGGGAFKGVPAILAVDAIWNIQQKYGEGFLPAIVPPSYAKLQGLPWLKQTWRAALHALAQAKLILFIGYSLPRSDGFMSALMTGAMALRTDKTPPTVLVVDPCPEVHKRFADLWGPLKSGWDPMGFADAVRGAIPQALERVIGQPSDA